MSVHDKALQGIFDDLDDFETKKMFPSVQPDGKGFSVTITMNPDQSHDEQETSEGGDEGMEDLPADHDEDECMSNGGCAMHKGGLAMSEGGAVPPMPVETEDLALPPFLRKKKSPFDK